MRPRSGNDCGFLFYMGDLGLADLVFCAGLALAAAGVWLVYPPASLILAGVGLMVAGLALARKGGRG